MQRLDLLLFNVQDLYVFMDKYNGEDLEAMREPEWQKLSASFFPNKSLEKLYSLKQIIEDADPDVAMLVEVGGRQSLINFNKHFLDEKYDIFFERSNSNRGIDVGYLCKKNTGGFKYFLKSHNADKLPGGRRYSRGLLELRVLKDSKLAATLLLTHLKSKLDLKKEDFEGRGQRGAEVEGILKTVKKIQINHPSTPIMICGDLNGIIYKEDTEEELQAFEKAGFFDAFELMNLPLEDRHTYYYFNKRSDRVAMQLDYILAQKKFADRLLNAKVLDMDPEKIPHPPENLKQKTKLPSDHYPVFTSLLLP